MRSRAPLAAALLLALPLLFFDLGGPWLWEDEADTAVFARRIVANGLPVAWDGHAFADSDHGRRVVPRLLGRDFVMVGTPWLPYYAAGASFALFGVSNTAARLPFALAALGSVALLYLLVQRATGCRRAALAAALLLLANVQFLLYAREARSYALNMLLTLAVLHGFLRLRERPRDVWLAVAAVLLFHTQILPAGLALATCGALALAHPRFRPLLPALLRRAPWVIAATLPWLAVGWAAVATNWKPIGAAGEWPGRVAQLGAESMVAIPWLGWIVALPLVARRLRSGDRDLLAIAGVYVACVVALLPLVLNETLLLVVGLRYVCALLPIAAAVTGLVVARASDGRPRLYAALLALFGATHLAGNALPWLALGEGRNVAGVFVNAPRERVEKLANAHWWYFVHGLGEPDPGTLPPLADFVNGATGPEQVVVTNFGWDPLLFYTGRRQGYRVWSDAGPVFAAARAELPAFVTSFDAMEWLVWRHAADPLDGLPFDAVRARVEAAGARLEPAARFREGLWENRPELHWHRFPRVGYPFAPRRLGAEGRKYPDAVVYRVVRDAGVPPEPTTAR